MKLTESEKDEIRRLCDALVDETISPDDHRKLEQWLVESPDASAFYVEYIDLSAMLFLHADESTTDVTAAVTTEQPRPATDERRVKRRWPVALAASLLVALTGTIYLTSTRNQQDPPDVQLTAQSAVRPAEADAPVAVLVDATDADWGRDDLAGASGIPLRKGWLELNSGSAVIQFNSGALVTLEGPAKLRLLNGKHGYLEHGQLAATVPEQAIGFRIDSPAIELVDLGTEFHIDSAKDGTTEVHVLDGAVEVQHDDVDNNAQTIELRENEARTFTKGELPQHVDFNQELRSKAPSPRTHNRIGYYTFDSSGSGMDEDSYVTDPSARTASDSGVQFHDFTYHGVVPGPVEFVGNLNRWSFKEWRPEYAVHNYYVAFAVEAEGANRVRLNQLALEVFRAGGETRRELAPQDGLLCVSSDGFKTFTEFTLLEGFTAVDVAQFKTVDLSRLPPAERFEFRFVFKGPSKARAIRLDEVTLDVGIEGATD